MKNRTWMVCICVGFLVVTGATGVALADSQLLVETQRAASSSRLAADALDDGSTAPMSIMVAAKTTCGRGAKGYTQEDCDWLYQACCQSSPFVPATICEDVWTKQNCDGCNNGCGSGW